MYDSIKNSIDFVKLVEDIKAIEVTPALGGGGSANFVKEPYLNIPIEWHSNNVLKFVDEKDYDFTSPIGTIENKSQGNLLFTYGGKYNAPSIKNTCSTFTLKNKNTNKKIGLNKKFDHLMLTQTSGQFVMAMIPYANIIPYIEEQTDKWIVKGLPVGKLDILHSQNIKHQYNVKPFIGLQDIIRVQLKERHS